MIESPRALLSAARPATSTDEDHVSTRDLDTRLILPRVKVFWRNGSPRFEIGNALQTRDIHQDPASDDAVFEGCDIELGRARVCDYVWWKTVVQLMIVKTMAERIHVGIGNAVIRHRVCIDRKSQTCRIAGSRRHDRLACP